MSKINGYPIVYMPDRDDVIGTSGCVYEHILVAESILGRRLLPGETVHHKDRSRENNSPENIMVFKTKKEPYIPKKVKRININTQETVVFNSISEAAKAIEKPDTHIRSVCNGKRKSAYGYYWEYVD